MMLMGDLKAVVEQVSTNETILEHHSKTLTYHKPSMPDAVVFPKTEEELVGIVNVAKEYKKPMQSVRKLSLENSAGLRF